MSARGPSPPHRRIEAWLWTGPTGHFAGGLLDLLVAFARYRLLRARARTRRARS